MGSQIREPNQPKYADMGISRLKILFTYRQKIPFDETIFSWLTVQKPVYYAKPIDRVAIFLFRFLERLYFN
jgi:hypothetical protein